MYAIDNAFFKTIITISAALMLFIEFIEYQCSNCLADYIQDLWNILDLSGNLLIIISTVFGNKGCLVFAVLILGIRCLS